MGIPIEAFSDDEDRPLQTRTCHPGRCTCRASRCVWRQHQLGRTTSLSSSSSLEQIVVAPTRTDVEAPPASPSLEDGSASAEPLSSSPDPGSHFRTIQSPSLLVQDSLFQDDLTPSHGSRRTLQTSDYADISSHRLGQRQVYGPELVSHLEPQMHMWRSVRSREAAAQWAAQVDGYDYYHASDPEQGDDDNEEAR